MAPVTFPLLIPILLAVVAAVAIYLLLPHSSPADLRPWKIGGAVALSVVLLIVAILTGRSAAWWPAPGRSVWPLVGHDLLAGLSIASAVVILASPRPVFSLAAGALLLLSGGTLCCLHGAILTGSAMLVTTGVLAVVAWQYREKLLVELETASGTGTGPEPFLACLATALLAALLIGGVDDNLHAPRTQDIDGLRGAIERIRLRWGIGVDGHPVAAADSAAAAETAIPATGFVPEALGLTAVLLAVMAGGVLLVYRSVQNSGKVPAAGTDPPASDSLPTSGPQFDSHV